MNDPLLQQLMQALTVGDASRLASGAAPSKPWRAYARFLFTARRRVLETAPCPPPVVRRVHGLFLDHHQGGPVAGILRLIFDSWRDPVPALRGTPTRRDLRFEAPGVALDVRLEASEGGPGTLQVAAEPALPGLHISLRWDGGQNDAVLDETGYAEMVLDRLHDRFVLALRDGDAEIFRTIPLHHAE